MTKSRLFSRGFAARVLGLAAIVGLASSPALALDDDGHESLFQTFTGLLTTSIGIPGLSSPKENPTINYRERAPLVVPKGKVLRAPMAPVAKRNKAWPKDYDRERLRRAKSRAVSRGVVRRDDAGNEILSTRYLRDTGRLARSPARDVEKENCETRDPLLQPCNIVKHWNTLKNARKKDPTKDLIPGQEPPRTALTDPPRGLRSPSRRVKATWEAPDLDAGSVPDPSRTIREEAKREEAYR